MNDEDIKRGLSKGYINKIMTETVYYHFNEAGCSTKVKFLEIFIKFYDYQYIISTYHKLMELNAKHFNRQEKKKFEFLKIIMTQ